jgi:hypothetical protein
MIATGYPGISEDFAITLAKFDEPQFVGMLDPHIERYDGVNYCRFYLTGFVAYVKVDHRPAPAAFRELVIRGDRPITLPVRSLHASKDGAVVKDIARRTSRPKGQD